MKPHLKVPFLVAFPFLLSACAYADAPRVAVWDPGAPATGGRFSLDLDALNRVAQTLQKGGVSVTRIGGEGLSDPTQVSARKFDALFLPGDAFPRAATKTLRAFARNGGVLVALNGRVPFNVAIAKDGEGGSWTMNPKEPKFAWQSSDISTGALGLSYIYNPAKHEQGVHHFPTPLLLRYLPQAPKVEERLPSNWIVPAVGADGKPLSRVFPLFRSTRLDGVDTTPQLYISQSATGTGIIASNPIFTFGGDEKTWPLAGETLVALAKMAADLHSGKLKLDSSQAIALDANQPPPEPLRTREIKGSVEPDGARPLLRFGLFDGGSFELGAPLSGAKTLPASAKYSDFPRQLLPGARLTIALPDLGTGARYLRIRGAFNADGAGLRANFGPETVMNERFSFLDASGSGNLSAPNLVDVPAEFHRVVWLPPTNAKTLVLSNPGKAPVYFDALQIESRSQPAPLMVLGLNAPFTLGRGGKSSIPQSVSQTWGSMRASIRTQNVGAPDDPKRWNAVDRLMDNYSATGAPIELLLEGTPPWAAISPERLQAAKTRPTTVAPDPQKYADIVRRIVEKYRDHVGAYEIWNEADSQQFYIGSNDEYVTLFKTLAPIIRQLDPNAKIISTGMAGFKADFVGKMVDSGAMNDVDLFALHPYAGKSPAWDVPFGQLEGALYSSGISKPIYCNESGFTWRNAEWFQTPPNFTPYVQMRRLDVAMARLLSDKLNRLSVFHAGGDSHEFGLWDEKGQPRPAYAVFNDYLQLSGGHRLDVEAVGVGGEALSGLYVAASQKDDGSVVAVVNPAEIEGLQPPAPPQSPNSEFDTTNGWNYFNGRAKAANGQVTLTPSAGSYMGFSNDFALDAAQTPILEISVSAATAPVPLSLRWGGRSVSLPINGPGVFRFDLSGFAASGMQDGNIAFRPTSPVTLDFVHFLPRAGVTGKPLKIEVPASPVATAQPIPSKPVGVVLRVPLPKAGAWSASWKTGDVSKAVPLEVQSSNGQSFATVQLLVNARGVLKISPAN